MLGHGKQIAKTGHPMCSAPARQRSQRVEHTQSQNPHSLFTLHSPLVASSTRRSSLVKKNTRSSPSLPACMALSCLISGADLEYDQAPLACRRSDITLPLSPPLSSVAARSLLTLNCVLFAYTHLRESPREGRPRTPSACSCSQRART